MTYVDLGDLFERKKKIDLLKSKVKPLRLTPFDWDTTYRDEAVKCFEKNLPISCIVVSSALVETCLAWEYFSNYPKEKIAKIMSQKFDRSSLAKLFGKYLNSNIPLKLLMDSDEDIEDLRKLKQNERGNKISCLRYIRTRNKFAHGDLFYKEECWRFAHRDLLPKNKQELLDYGIDNAERENPTLKTIAYVHLSKTLKFMEAFTNLRYLDLKKDKPLV